MSMPSDTEPKISNSEYLARLNDVSLHVPTLTLKERKLSVNPLRIMAEFYGNKSGRDFKTLLLNLSFTIKAGERIGVMGRNGAGKTTLLRLLAGIYRPSSGVFNLNGTAYGLFNIQLGMNPNATGIENIYLRGLQMGLSLADIRSKVDEVYAFTELGPSMNELFGNYSTGMKLRLSFAISTILKPDLLLMDEWIGSGDEGFKQKVQDRMNEMVSESKSLVVATHNLPLIKRLCSHGIILEKGRILYYGSVDNALEAYSEHQKKSAIIAK